MYEWNLSVFKVWMFFFADSLASFFLFWRSVALFDIQFAIYLPTLGIYKYKWTQQLIEIRACASMFIVLNLYIEKRTHYCLVLNGCHFYRMFGWPRSIADTSWHVNGIVPLCFSSVLQLNKKNTCQKFNSSLSLAFTYFRYIFFTASKDTLTQKYLGFEIYILWFLTNI